MGVSIGTLRRAVDELAAEHIVVRRQGRGTFVATHNADRFLFQFFHVEREDGLQEVPHVELLSFERGRVDEQAAAALAVREGDPAIVIENRLSLQGRPVIHDRLVLPAALFRGLTEAKFARRPSTIYHLYQTEYGITVVRAHERARALPLERAIARVLGRASFILGEEVEAFEQAFASSCGAAHCVGVGNGTDALTLALQAVGVGVGDEVITTPLTFIATAEAISAVGARPVFVDVRVDTLLLDPARIEAALTARTRAIVPVHLYGQIVDMDPLLDLARSRGLAVVEDAAQAHGAVYRGRSAGSLGHVAAFSFYPGKNLGAYGDAGAVVTGDPDLARFVRQARDHGRTTKYEHEFVGRNSRLDGLQAAVLAVKLRHLPRWNERRRELAAAYDHALADVPALRPVARADYGLSACHLYVVRAARRDGLLASLRAAGIGAGVHYPVALHRQKAYASLGLGPGALPVAEAASREVLSLPLYPELPWEDVGAIAAELGRAAGGIL
ncbi:MAG: DegT/DnrJ/EryC1/StrS family aminotransferase [Deltaproteobacteria bacterium]|nr:DegT/DnrJ/EryC1/StrS family aminotransferase [Deltaproteobacteria bacterium]